MAHGRQTHFSVGRKVSIAKRSDEAISSSPLSFSSSDSSSDKLRLCAVSSWSRCCCSPGARRKAQNTPGADGSLIPPQAGPQLTAPSIPVVDPAAAAIAGGNIPMPLPELEGEVILGPERLADWSVQLDVLALSRNTGSTAFLGETSVGVGGPVVGTLNVNDVAFTMQPGARIALLRTIDDRVQWETLYFGLQSWSVSNTLEANPLAGVVGTSPFTQADKLIGGFGQSLGYSYTSQLENLEFNARRRYGNRYFTASPLVGLRYFQWNEGLNISGSDQYFGVNENLTTKAGNYMFGLQGGADVKLNWRRLTFDVTGKAGIFLNLIENRQSNGNSTGIASLPGGAGFNTFDTSSRSVGAATVLDLSATLSYRFTDHFELRGGYQCLYVGGLALAPEQLGSQSHSGDLFLHGPMAGFQANW